MVVSRALKATGCASCRLSLLRSFAAITGIPPRTLHLNAKASCSSAPRVRFSSSTIHNAERIPDIPQETINKEKLDENTDTELIEEDAEAGKSLELSAIPWYLGVNAPQRKLQPLSEREQLPELPELPPSILQPLLQQISIDLGIDSLTLLDLRKLDPPPALGPNLIMVIGTARSEKHLHVSADRLCRWLRSTYKLRPDADGLLGRNELKLKLKRKAKRAKLLGKGTASTADNEDDGVRTGWVCVDVGVVDGVEGSKSSIAEPEGFVGFGRRTDGVRIVVQMMTEEKREEMNLEHLWRGIFKRGVPAEIEAPERVAAISEPSTSVPDHALTDGSMRRLGNGSPTLLQARGFHTSARCHMGDTRAIEPGQQPTMDGPTAETNKQEMPVLKEVMGYVALCIGSGQYQDATKYLLQHKNNVPELQNEGWRRLLLNQLRVYLESVPSDQALLILGTKQLGHTGYNFDVLMALFGRLQRDGVEVSTAAYLNLIRSVLRPLNVDSKYDGPPRHVVKGAMKILQTMYDQGHPILTEDTFVMLQEATAPTPGSSPPSPPAPTSSHSTFDLPSVQMSPIQRRLHVLMKSIDMPPFAPSSRLRLLDLYSRQNNWKEFWDLWRFTYYQGQPQTPELWAFMFGRAAETGHRIACQKVLRTWVQYVEREAVPLRGEVGEAVKACLRVANPFVERDAGDANVKGEWLSMWRMCTEAEE